MDKKTVFLLLTEALLVVILVVVVAMDYEPGPQTETVVVETSVEEGAAAAAAPEAAEAEAHVAEKAEAEPAEAVEAEPAEQVAEAAEEAVEEVAEAAGEVAEKVEEVAAEAGGGGDMADVIPMENSLYPKHTKPIVQFTHAKHFTDYKVGCGDCHHDDSGQPLADLKPGDAVVGCGECHSEPGRPGKEAKTPADKLAYHMQAMHQNCITCHKDFNKENGVKDAPQTCGECHPKEG